MHGNQQVYFGEAPIPERHRHTYLYHTYLSGNDARVIYQNASVVNIPSPRQFQLNAVRTNLTPGPEAQTYYANKNPNAKEQGEVISQLVFDKASMSGGATSLSGREYASYLRLVKILHKPSRVLP